MSAAPFICAADEVVALLAGTLTELRRPANVSPSVTGAPEAVPSHASCARGGFHFVRPDGRCEWHVESPFGPIGDRLWVREAWGVGSRPDPVGGWRDGIEYRADGVGLDDGDVLPLHPAPEGIDLSVQESKGWRRARRMPRWASRFTLETTAVRVEQSDGTWWWVGTVRKVETT